MSRIQISERLETQFVDVAPAAGNKALTRKPVELKFEVLLDEPDIGRIVRAGNWILTTYPDGHGEWEWEGDYGQERIERQASRAAARQPREISRSDPAGEVAERVRAAPHRYSLL